MKTAKELTAERFETPESLKRRAVGLRRLAGGLRAETERSNDTGLTDKELRTLKEAIDLLAVLATRFDGAAKEKKKLVHARDAMEQKVREALKSNFGSLKSIPDQVAFVAAAGEYQLKNLNTVADLRHAITENIDYVVRRLAEQAMSRDMNGVITDAWNKFQSIRADLQHKHAATIDRLTTTAQSA